MQIRPIRPKTSGRSATASHIAAVETFSQMRSDRLHDAMRRHIENGELPGLVALVRHRTREHVEVLGSFAFDGDMPMRRDTLFRLASMTKPITAVGAMTLIEECKLRLDDPVDEWLPELKDRRVLRTIASPIEDTVPAKRRITLRDLLTFQSGYGELGFLSPTCALAKAMSKAKVTLAEWPFAVSHDEFMKNLGSLPLAHQPGERWLYHTGSEILGVLLARVSGKSLGTFLTERIFEPLGMRDTGFYVPDTKLDRLPACYARDFTTGKIVLLYEGHGGRFATPPAFESGGGGLVSTVDDMLAFGQMMLNYGSYGHERILSRPTVELMTADHVMPEQKSVSPFFENYWHSRSWGLGVGIVTRRSDLAEVPGRFGWDGAFGTSWYVDPKEQMVGVLMMQRCPDSLAIPAVTLDFWNSAYQLIDD